MKGRRFACAVALWSLALHGSPSVPAPEASGEASYEEYETRAAFLLSLAKFTQWPDRSLPPGEPLVVGVLGDSPLAEGMESLARNPWLGRKVVVRRFRRASEIQACNILYFPREEEQALPGLKARLAAEGVLTVGETSFFIGYGGALQLFKEGGRLRFILNRPALDQAHLRVAAQAQTLAKKVIE